MHCHIMQVLQQRLIWSWNWSKYLTGESARGGLCSSTNILIYNRCNITDVEPDPRHWTISFAWLTWPREVEMFSLSSRQSRYWVLLPLHQVTTHLPSCELTYLTKHGYLLLPCFIHAQVSSKLFRALNTFSRSSNAMEQGVFEIASEWPDTPMHL